MKTTTSLGLLLALTGSAFAQEASMKAATNATAENPTGGDSVVTGQAVTQDVTGRTVFVSSERPVPPVHDYRAEFDALDRDKDGAVSRSEADADKYLVRAFENYDSDRNDRLSFEEALPWLDD